jgi:serine/threonine protein kinase
MANVYGGRWQIASAKPLAKNAQAEILRVTDNRNKFEGDYALKCVLRPARQERFRREIAAVTQLRHPNVIGLVDASALNDATGSPEKQYLVMPIAGGGDLGRKRRVEANRGSLDFVTQVGRQIASALMTAHDEGIIHRDLKPGNVLFMGLGHEIWLSDFGISLIREPAAPSDDPVVVGQQSFLAPELEGGRQLDVPPAADVYSLGKLLYFMFSGGAVLPEGDFSETQDASLFREGKARNLLGSLLAEMICPLENRLKTVPEVTRRLEDVAFSR